ncbi:MAG TPA: hypothetical protein VGG27_15655 [Magnetospirillaceae bacterium]|jgi:MFS family permease
MASEPHIAPQDAAASLSDVEVIERRTREAVRYAYASTFQIMWGTLVAIGYIAEYISPKTDLYSWIAVLVVGIIGGITIRRSRANRSGRPVDWRVVYGQIALVAFGFLWTTLLTDATPRQINALWPTFYMFTMVLFGIWVGRFFVGLGLVVTALVAVGYLWAGDWFLPWMAVVAGGGCIASGLYLRRIGLQNQTLP